QGADANYADREGCTPLIVATGGCRFGVDIDAKGRMTTNSVEGGGSVEMVTALLAGGANPDKANPHGDTPLMHASRFGRTETVRALLDARANPNLHDSQGFTALHSAAGAGHVEIVQALLQHGAERDARRND